ncbi:MurR/RpiR family transcriptional regulator [Psychrobacillus sp. FSL H8-0483]|uniref:MurR/RpiR family transcriptional regulator n=1 Tax=Psychrobacillus sp. FSL H8-0483 TaxID=2921389 RepID=UPI003159CB86
MEEFMKILRENFEILSKSQQRVAKLIFDNPSIITFSTALEIGGLANVSESTVIRFSQTLGYKGFTDLQDTIRQSIPQGRILVQSQEVTNFEQSSLLNDLVIGDIHNLQQLIQNIDDIKLRKVVADIGKAEKIYVVGNLSTYGLAHFFSQWLQMLLGNAELLTLDSINYYSQISKIDKNTVVIPIIFPRYINSTLKVAQQSKEHGAKIIAITDSELSPIAAYADELLTVPINSKIEIDSYTAVMALINALTRYISILEKTRVRENLENIEQLYLRNNIFFSK